MSAELLTADDCWNRIGVSGDHSCPELQQAIHCRNCPVFAAAARSFFDRPAPEGYLAEWSALLGGDQESAAGDADRVSVLIFRLHGDWLAVDVRSVVEVTAVRPVHRIPYRTDNVLAGLVNLRGQLHLSVSLHGLLDVAPAADPASHAAQPRMVVIRQGAEAWVFTADEVLGVHRVPRTALRAAPSTLADPAVSFSQAVFAWHDRSVGYLDEQRVFAALRSVGQ
jgi:chemotaxis-related protein WspD